MLAMLPAVRGPQGCRLPSVRTIGALASGLASSKRVTDISLPKVSLAETESLKHVLISLGMGLAFSDLADFAGLSPQACCIGFVRHAAKLAWVANPAVS
jgi:serine protease inhibitor